MTDYYQIGRNVASYLRYQDLDAESVADEEVTRLLKNRVMEDEDHFKAYLITRVAGEMKNLWKKKLTHQWTRLHDVAKIETIDFVELHDFMEHVLTEREYALIQQYLIHDNHKTRAGAALGLNARTTTYQFNVIFTKLRNSYGETPMFTKTLLASELTAKQLATICGVTNKMIRRARAGDSVALSKLADSYVVNEDDFDKMVMERKKEWDEVEVREACYQMGKKFAEAINECLNPSVADISVEEHAEYKRQAILARTRYYTVVRKASDSNILFRPSVKWLKLFKSFKKEC